MVQALLANQVVNMKMANNQDFKIEDIIEK